MIRFALFGAGFIGRVHGANLAACPRTKLQYVYDVNREAATRLADRFGAKVANSVEEIFAADDVDAVLIASSTNTHADLLSAAIQARKPAYCEKPIDMDLERVKAVVRQAHDNPVPIMIGFSRRFDPNHRRLKQLVQAGEVGVTEMILMVCRSAAPPPLDYIKVSGGQFRDQTIHMFDLLCWITGQAPVEVYATGSSMMDPAIAAAGDVDTSMLILKFADGALCHIDNSRHTGYGYDERIEVFGSQGLVESRRKPTHEVAVYKGDKILEDGMFPGWFERMEPSFLLALDAFAASLEGVEGIDYPTLQDGLRAQMIAEAAVESLKTNMPVKITYWQPT
ncbi:MAG: Gfo/Idh/MocA family oxidoreductase [Caldilinea sp.]|nr:Gfo/Idh/MocA family oxidoreductase [Caldilinea sp.]MDW8441429.1 Gfo/Idh/MocA family oxidoreductase [Caldilineaceae bacterium]